MLAGESLGIVFFTALRRAEPAFLELLVIYPRARHLEPMPYDAALRPRLNRRPCAGTELLERVRRDRSLRMRPRGHDPMHDERD